MAQAKVDEKDPQAAALAYAADTTKVDAKKFPKHTNDQKCSNCQLYTGKAKEASGPCSLFAGKHVALPMAGAAPGSRRPADAPAWRPHGLPAAPQVQGRGTPRRPPAGWR
jgi:hypothetical protein